MRYGYSKKLIDANRVADQTALGVRLGKLCIHKDIPVAEVALRLSVSRQTVYNWFVGASSPRQSISPTVRDLFFEIKQS